MQLMQDRLLTPDQVGEMLQLHPFTILNYIKQGKLRSARIGRVYRIRESDIEKFLDSQMLQPSGLSIV
ncbi:helix-turn-helix domain-containing protein [Candidatus Gracilibacteria bacterium]|nr:helix-turn-helix domain-containing protein [Candidatus Gracilibacteria bacterium]